MAALKPTADGKTSNGTSKSFDVVTRSDGGSSCVRSTYQSCGRMTAPNGRKIDFTAYQHQHIYSAIVAPPGAPEWATKKETLWTTVAAHERRRDAQECRTIELAIPRELPRHLWVPLCVAIAVMFAQLGMVVQLDVECPVARDGLLNPHCHFMITMRRLDGDGFARRKVREWNYLFFNRGSEMRWQIADCMREFCLEHNIDYRPDPRSNVVRGLPAPEITLSREHFEIENRTGLSTPSLMLRDEHRAHRHRYDDVNNEIAAALLEREAVRISTLEHGDDGTAVRNRTTDHVSEMSLQPVPAIPQRMPPGRRRVSSKSAFTNQNCVDRETEVQNASYVNVDDSGERRRQSWSRFSDHAIRQRLLRDPVPFTEDGRHQDISAHTEPDLKPTRLSLAAADLLPENAELQEGETCAEPSGPRPF